MEQERYDNNMQRTALKVVWAGFMLQIVAVALALAAAIYVKTTPYWTLVWILLASCPSIVWLLVRQLQVVMAAREQRESDALLQADPNTRALFDSAGQQLSLAQSRIAQLDRVGRPVLSIALGVVWLFLGGWSFYGAYKEWRNASFDGFASLPDGVSGGLLLMLLILPAIASLLLARYQSGMANKRQWQLLRVSAGQLLYGALAFAFAILMSAGWVMGYPKLSVVLGFLLAGQLILMGIEVLTVQVLVVYQPRKSGQQIRPAFDSRLMGLVGQPTSIGATLAETFRYQFGYAISRRVALQAIARYVAPFVGAVVGLVWLATGIVNVAPQERAVIWRNGEEVVLEPGLHFGMPWPFQQSQVIPVGKVSTFYLGDSLTDGSQTTLEDWQVLLSSDLPGHDMENMRVYGSVMWRVAEDNASVLAYNRLAYSRKDEDKGAEIEQHLSAQAQQVLLEVLASHTVTQLMQGTQDIEANLRETLQARLSNLSHATGVEILAFNLRELAPPATDLTSYNALAGARIAAQSAQEQAEYEAEAILLQVAGDSGLARQIVELQQARGNDLLVALRQSQGEVASRLAQARSARWEVVSDAHLRISEESALSLLYESAESFTITELVLQSLETALANRPIVLIHHDGEKEPNIDYSPQSGGQIGGILSQ